MEIILLIKIGFNIRRCYPMTWCGAYTREAVLKYALYSSRKLSNGTSVLITCWQETEVGNDIFIAAFENGVRIE